MLFVLLLSICFYLYIYVCVLVSSLGFDLQTDT